jgi:hypothetical protein
MESSLGFGFSPGESNPHASPEFNVFYWKFKGFRRSRL